MSTAVEPIVAAIREHAPHLAIAFTDEELKDHTAIFLHRLEILGDVAAINRNSDEDK